MSHPNPQSTYGENEIAESKYGYGDADIHPNKRPMKPSETIRKLAEEYQEKYGFTVTAASLAAIVAYLDEQVEKEKHGVCNLCKAEYLTKDGHQCAGVTIYPKTSQAKEL